MRNKYEVNDFRALYTFYYPGFNLRSTDLQAFLGIEQLKNLDNIVDKRHKNFQIYNQLINDKVWKIKPPKQSYVSNFAFPIITKNIDTLVNELNKNNIECRPLICGAMNKQPFWYETYGKKELPNSIVIHEFGLYLPNHQDLEYEEIKLICEIVNKFA